MIDYSFPMLVGEEKVTSERKLTNKVEGGEMMNGAESVRFIVIHCSATRADRDYTPEQMLRDHRARGFRTIGYHAYIRKDGTTTYHRHWLEVGAHAKPYNRCSIGICYEGGIEAPSNSPRGGEASGKSNQAPSPRERDGERLCDTRTAAQRKQLLRLLTKLKRMFPKAKIVGHRDLPGATPKDCPCFDATTEYASL